MIDQKRVRYEEDAVADSRSGCMNPACSLGITHHGPCEVPDQQTLFPAMPAAQSAVVESTKFDAVTFTSVPGQLPLDLPLTEREILAGNQERLLREARPLVASLDEHRARKGQIPW